ncbi:unnamed protein product, partial [Symbiodinium microadriaticum]
DDGLKQVTKALVDAFQPCQETALPRAMETALFGPFRSSRETKPEFLVRFTQSQRTLRDEGVELRSKAQGYLLYRQANLDRDLDARLLIWLAGDYSLDRNLRRLDGAMSEGCATFFEDGGCGENEDQEWDEQGRDPLPAANDEHVVDRKAKEIPHVLVMPAGIENPGATEHAGILEEVFGPVARTPSKAEKEADDKLHRNLGHPNNRELSRALSIGRAAPHVIKYAQENYKCPSCEAHRAPKWNRPTMMPKSYAPNVVLGVDLMQEPNFLPIFVTEQPSSTLSSIRLEHARHINTGARKDMERCVFTQLLEKARWELPPSDHADWVLLLRETESNKNRMFNRSGYSPVQRMFGHLPRTVGEVCSDFAIDPAVLDHAADLHKLLGARRAAEGLCRGEYGLCSQGGASQQGAHAETAQPRRGDLRLEVLEKPGVLEPCWVGPAIVPMPEGVSTCRAAYGKCEHLRPGISEEVRGIEAVPEVCQDLKARIDRAQAEVIEDHTGDALPEAVVRAVPKGGGLEVKQEGALRGAPRPRPEEPETPVPARPLVPDA